MPGSSTTPGCPCARAVAPVHVAFRLRNGVGTRDRNLCGAQWLAYVFPYRRFAAVLKDDRARLGADVNRYSVIVSDLHRLLLAGLPAHCERFWTLPPYSIASPAIGECYGASSQAIIGAQEERSSADIVVASPGI